MPAKFVHPVLRFYKYVNRAGPIPTNDPTLGPCSQWTGLFNDRGRALFTQHSRTIYAARWLWLYFNGPVPPDLCVCHRCNNAMCVRLDHLKLDTSPENCRFRHFSGRSGYPGRKILPVFIRPPRKSLLERFESKVVKSDGCWLWQGSRDDSGYGTMWNGYQTEDCHRVSWKLYRGPIPAGQSVLHDCNTPRCVSPFHLHLGTQQRNIEERDEAGRGNQPRGAKHGRAKLTEESVLEIRRLHATGLWSYVQLAKNFGVNDGTVWCIIKRRNWAWL